MVSWFRHRRVYAERIVAPTSEEPSAKTDTSARVSAAFKGGFRKSKLGLLLTVRNAAIPRRFRSAPGRYRPTNFARQWPSRFAGRPAVSAVCSYHPAVRLSRRSSCRLWRMTRPRPSFARGWSVSTSRSGSAATSGHGPFYEAHSATVIIVVVVLRSPTALHCPCSP